jgi:hypothetical protein
MSVIPLFSKLEYSIVVKPFASESNAPTSFTWVIETKKVRHTAVYSWSFLDTSWLQVSPKTVALHLIFYLSLQELTQRIKIGLKNAPNAILIVGDKYDSKLKLRNHQAGTKGTTCTRYWFEMTSSLFSRSGTNCHPTHLHKWVQDTRAKELL